MRVGNHLKCAAAAAVMAAFGVACAAYGQDAVAPLASADPTGDMIALLVREGGLPVVLALIGWYARSIVVSGIPVTVRLSDEDRALLAKVAAVVGPKG
jgi:hypothetical protein